MVSGLLVPTVMAYFSRYQSKNGAFYSMLGGGGLTLFLLIVNVKMPLGLDHTFWGILLSLILYLGIMFYERLALSKRKVH